MNGAISYSIANSDIGVDLVISLMMTYGNCVYCISRKLDWILSDKRLIDSAPARSAQLLSDILWVPDQYGQPTDASNWFAIFSTSTSNSAADLGKYGRI